MKLTKDLIVYWRSQLEQYGPSLDLVFDLPNGPYAPKELIGELLYAAEVGLAMNEAQKLTVERLRIAVELLEQIAADSGTNRWASYAQDALKKLGLP